MKKFLLALVLTCTMAAAVACGSKSEDNSGVNSNNNGSVNESNKDSNEPTGWEFGWTAPEEFVSDDGELYITSDYPTDSSNITYTHSADDGTGLDFTAEDYETLLESTYAELGMTIDVTIDKFESIETNGCEGLYIESHYSMAEIELIQIQYAYQTGDEVHTVCYTAVGAAWLDTFKENAKTITLTPIYE